MNRVRLVLAAALICAAAGLPAILGGEQPASGAVRKPNVVLITTDDQTRASLAAMPRVRRLLVERGASFVNNITSFPLCCPSRASWITGQYAHNHGVIDNQERNGGGYQSLRDPERVLPAWLDLAGYDTALVGKWLHDYRTLQPAPGWDRFWAMTSSTMVDYYGYEITDSRGGKVAYGDDTSDYLSDVLTREYAVPYIRAHRADPDPFFLHVSYTAPHWGRGRSDAAGRRCANGKPFKFETAKAKPAPRDAGAFPRRPLPMPPSFNEADMSDKPGAVRGRRRLDRRAIADLTERYRCELASLRAVDRAVGEIDAALDRARLPVAPT
jgi:arylsulfatase A-like enzyme